MVVFSNDAEPHRTGRLKAVCLFLGYQYLRKRFLEGRTDHRIAVLEQRSVSGILLQFEAVTERVNVELVGQGVSSRLACHCSREMV